MRVRFTRPRPPGSHIARLVGGRLDGMQTEVVQCMGFPCYIQRSWLGRMYEYGFWRSRPLEYMFIRRVKRK